MRDRTADAILLMGLKGALGAWLLYTGFTHVSDDDYARTVIAEQFAHAPRLDPSGTSWLPLPFWILGGAMVVGGRSLETARVLAFGLGAASVAGPYLAMRSVGVARGAAFVACALAMVVPWNAWLGIATVPESWTGALIASALIAAPTERAAPWVVGAILVASLSRYEAWPACAVISALFARRSLSGWREGRPGAIESVAAAVLVVAGPVAWMAWNSHAHGSALHFVARVSTYRHAIGAADVSFSSKLLDYPKALLLETPEIAVLGVAGIAGLALGAHRARWSWPLSGALAVLLFLVWGDLRDGAPTHHPARALAPTWWIFAGSGVDALRASWERFATKSRVRVTAALVAAGTAAAWTILLPARWAASPGRSQSERRDRQIALGLSMRSAGVSEADIVPCAYEHFAVLAAWGRPEAARIEAPSGDLVVERCPRVVTGLAPDLSSKQTAP